MPTLDKRIDFTRTTAATYVDSDGYIKSTPASKNLLTYTQEFDNAAWAKIAASVYPFDPETVSLGPELVANGTFDSEAGWTISATAPATANIAGGKLTLVSPAGETASAYQAIVVAGRWYKVTGSVVVRSGSAKVDMGAVAVFTSTQSFTVFLKASGAFALSRNGACDADFDNVSVREVIGGLITAPDGTMTADALVANGGTAARSLSQSGGSSGSAQTFSIFVKAGTSNFVQLYHGSSSNIFADFNLATGVVGTVGSSATAAIESAGNGWYRCAITFTPGSASACRAAMITSATAAYAESWTATGAESLYLWGAQVELGSTATSYTRNVGGLFTPRFDYDPVTKAPRGLLVEEQLTNLLTYSEQFDAANWVKDQATISVNSVLSPDGTLDADTIVASATSNRHIVQRNGISPAVAAGSPATLSFYAKAAGYNFASASILWGAISSGVGVVFDLINLTATSLGATAGVTLNSASVVDAGNGWRRCIMTVTNASYALNYVAIGPCSTGSPAIENGSRTATFTGDGTSGIYVWGAQLEAGSFATSYIPTQASQVTRTADIATITGANFSNWYNQSAGTFVVEADSFVGVNKVNSYVVFAANDGTSQNRIRVHLYNGLWAPSMTAGGSEQLGGSISGQYTSGVPAKIAFGIKGGDVGLSVNGSNVLLDTVNTVPIVNQLALINSAIGGGALNGHIRSIKYWPTRLSNAQLQALTAP